MRFKADTEEKALMLPDKLGQASASTEVGEQISSQIVGRTEGGFVWAWHKPLFISFILPESLANPGCACVICLKTWKSSGRVQRDVGRMATPAESHVRTERCQGFNSIQIWQICLFFCFFYSGDNTHQETHAHTDHNAAGWIYLGCLLKAHPRIGHLHQTTGV